MQVKNRRLKRIGGVVLGLTLLGALGYAAAFWHTERLLRVEPVDLNVKLPAGDASEGQRLSRVLGCQACHSKDLSGGVFADIPLAALIIAPNLTTLRERYDDAAFLRLMRTGAKLDGRLALAMPVKAFQRLTDRQLGDLLAYLRQVPVVPVEQTPTTLRPLGRVAAALGHYDIPSMHADAPESPAVLADRKQPDRGLHLLQTACGECHGMDLAGFPEEGIPPLRVLAAYSEADFARLMREGITLSGGDSATGMMSAVARHRFALLRDEEIAAMRQHVLGSLE